MDLLVMENLLYGRSLSRIYDLKGSVRSRYNDSKGSNAVLLDENLLETMPTAPIFVGNKAKRLLERAVWNDTAFLAVHAYHSWFCRFPGLAGSAPLFTFPLMFDLTCRLYK